MASVALAAFGPGALSADHLLGLDRKLAPWHGAAIAAGVGLGAAAVQLAVFWRKPKPHQEQEAAG